MGQTLEKTENCPRSPKAPRNLPGTFPKAPHQHPKPTLKTLFMTASNPYKISWYKPRDQLLGVVRVTRIVRQARQAR
ncbi:hypothetical protein BJ956_000447 [Arthrobacter psychrochitiniphilus]|nr:hypothetical protein [Arthrobacter psychrochitiniphilus]